MAVLNRRDYYAAIPQLEGRLSKLSKYITVEEGKLQIKIDDLYGNVATLTQTAESIESRVEGIEDDYVTSTVLTQTKNALTLEINEKAQVFTSQPTTPYYVGDLWTQGPNGEIYRCKTNRLSGNYTASDWEKASDYTDDTTANAEKNNRTMLIRSFGGGTITAYQGNSYGVYTNASGSVDIVTLSWNGSTPSITGTLASYGSTTTIGNRSGTYWEFASDGLFWHHNGDAEVSDIAFTSTYSGGYTVVAQTIQGTSQIKGGSISGSSLSVSGSISGGSISGSSLSVTGSVSGSSGTFTSSSDAIVADHGSIKNLWAVTNSSSDAVNMHIGTQGRIYMTSKSSKRFKNSISEIKLDELDPHHLYDIEVNQFKYNTDYIKNPKDARYDSFVPGFIAEQMYEHYPVAIDLDDEGKPNDWNMKFTIPPMLALIQEQNERIKVLERRIECLNESRK